MTEKAIELDLDDAGVASRLPRPQHPSDEVQQVPFRPVQFRDDDLHRRPRAIRRLAARRSTRLGEPLDVIAIHLDYDDREGTPYYEVKLLCNEEDLAGAPLAARATQQADVAARTDTDGNFDYTRVHPSPKLWPLPGTSLIQPFPIAAFIDIWTRWAGGEGPRRPPGSWPS